MQSSSCFYIDIPQGVHVSDDDLKTLREEWKCHLSVDGGGRIEKRLCVLPRRIPSCMAEADIRKSFTSWCANKPRNNEGDVRQPQRSKPICEFAIDKRVPPTSLVEWKRRPPSEGNYWSVVFSQEDRGLASVSDEQFSRVFCATVRDLPLNHPNVRYKLQFRFGTVTMKKKNYLDKLSVEDLASSLAARSFTTRFVTEATDNIINKISGHYGDEFEVQEIYNLTLCETASKKEVKVAMVRRDGALHFKSAYQNKTSVATLDCIFATGPDLRIQLTREVHYPDKALIEDFVSQCSLGKGDELKWPRGFEFKVSLIRRKTRRRYLQGDLVVDVADITTTRKGVPEDPIHECELTSNAFRLFGRAGVYQEKPNVEWTPILREACQLVGGEQ